MKIDVILTQGTPAVSAAMKATRTIPIVMTSGEPVSTGVVRALARPGANVTGLSSQIAETSGKRLQLLQEAAPRIRRIAAILDMGNPASVVQWQTMQRDAGPTGLEVQLQDVRKPENLAQAFDAAVRQRADAVVVGRSMQSNAKRIAELSIERRLPSMFPTRDFVDAGGLMAYGANNPTQYRRAAGYVDKVLKGMKPGDIQVEQPRKFELVINLKTAKARPHHSAVIASPSGRGDRVKIGVGQIRHATGIRAPIGSTSARATNGLIAMPPNPTLNRTGRYAASTWRASARLAG